jgi:hypothetical protein
MRATKITKYFECENKNPLYYTPKNNSYKNEKIDTGASKTTSSSTSSSPNNLISSSTNNSFDSINIQLETKYYQAGATIEYGLYFNNNCQLDIKGTITNVGNAIVGDLMALNEVLKYIVYHPNISQKLNKYKFNIYTNSKTIVSVYKPDSSYMSSNLYFKIQSLLKCIKNVSIELWNS